VVCGPSTISFLHIALTNMSHCPLNIRMHLDRPAAVHLIPPHFLSYPASCATKPATPPVPHARIARGVRRRLCRRPNEALPSQHSAAAAAAPQQQEQQVADEVWMQPFPDDIDDEKADGHTGGEGPAARTSSQGRGKLFQSLVADDEVPPPLPPPPPPPSFIRKGALQQHGSAASIQPQPIDSSKGEAALERSHIRSPRRSSSYRVNRRPPVFTRREQDGRDQPEDVIGLRERYEALRRDYEALRGRVEGVGGEWEPESIALEEEGRGGRRRGGQVEYRRGVNAGQRQEDSRGAWQNQRGGYEREEGWWYRRRREGGDPSYEGGRTNRGQGRRSRGRFEEGEWEGMQAGGPFRGVRRAGGWTRGDVQPSAGDIDRGGASDRQQQQQQQQLQEISPPSRARRLLPPLAVACPPDERIQKDAEFVADLQQVWVCMCVRIMFMCTLW